MSNTITSASASELPESGEESHEPGEHRQISLHQFIKTLRALGNFLQPESRRLNNLKTQ